jgi:methylmalonyl-CoA/ethylmalonyl-CoA epimerase
MTVPPATLSLSRIGQIAITVTDMERSVAYYRDVFGMRFLFRAPNVAFFDCDGIRLMLGQSEAPNQKPHGTAIYYRVENIQDAFEGLKSRSARVESPPHLIARMPDHDLWMAFFRDPDENLLAIMEEVRTGSRPT